MTAIFRYYGGLTGGRKPGRGTGIGTIGIIIPPLEAR